MKQKGERYEKNREDMRQKEKLKQGENRRKRDE